MHATTAINVNRLSSARLPESTTMFSSLGVEISLRRRPLEAGTDGGRWEIVMIGHVSNSYNPFSHQSVV